MSKKEGKTGRTLRDYIRAKIRKVLPDFSLVKMEAIKSRLVLLGMVGLPVEEHMLLDL